MSLEKTIVHIGPAIASLPEEVKPGEKHYCFDPGYANNPTTLNYDFLLSPGCSYEEMVERFMQKTNTYLLSDPSIEKLKKQGVEFFGQPAVKTPLSANSVDEIYAFNVFSAPRRTHTWKTFCEAERILKPSGSFYIGAFCTPEYFSLNNLQQVAEITGFDTEVLVDCVVEREITSEEAAIITNSFRPRLYCVEGNKMNNIYLTKLNKNLHKTNHYDLLIEEVLNEPGNSKLKEILF